MTVKAYGVELSDDAPERANAVPQQLAIQRESIDYLASTIDGLAARLAPVLGPDSPHALSEEKRVGISVALAEEISQNNDRLMDIRGRVENLVQRLGI